MTSFAWFTLNGVDNCVVRNQVLITIGALDGEVKNIDLDRSLHIARPSLNGDIFNVMTKRNLRRTNGAFHADSTAERSLLETLKEASGTSRVRRGKCGPCSAPPGPCSPVPHPTSKRIQNRNNIILKCKRRDHVIHT